VDWLTKQEAADYLKVSVRHLSRLPIPRSYVNSSPRFSRSAIDAWLEAQTVTPGQKERAARRSAPRINLAPADVAARIARLGSRR
jgi:hypothetical protein